MRRVLTVRAKLTLAFGMLAGLVLLVSGLSLKALADANARFANYIQGINARASLADEVQMAVGRRAISARNLVLVSDPKELEAEKATVARAHEDVQSSLAKLKAMAQGADVNEAARSLIGEIDRVEQAYGPVALAIVKLAAEGQRDEAIARMNKDCRPLLAALSKASADYSSYTEKRAEALVHQAEAELARQRAVVILACALAFLGAAVSGLMLTRSLGRALGAEPAALGEAAQLVAGGDLRPVEGAAAAPAGSVLASLALMQDKLAGIVRQVRDASESIATGSSQIATGNSDLSQRTEEQASALQQTAATMEELGTTVQNNAQHAVSASQLAQGASSVATEGGQVVAQVVETMEGINSSSKRIADIIGVIDGIAFQTNILALNAAVEAARAGDQGRGFAVVAGEVRSLAQRSATAAKEIKGLITASVEQVERGTTLVDEAGLKMREIVESIQRVSGVVSEISSASSEQSAGVSQVGQALTQMDQVTQQNAALVEESAAAAESLHGQAGRLVAAVAQFKL